MDCWPAWRHRASERPSRAFAAGSSPVRPAPALMVVLAAWAAVGAWVLAGRAPWAAWWWTGAALAMLAAFDGLRLRRQPTPQVERALPDALPVGHSRDVELQFTSTRRQHLEVFDLHPVGWPVQGLPQRLRRLLHGALDQLAHSGHAPGQAGGRALRAAGRGIALPAVRPPGTSRVLRVAATGPGDVRRQPRGGDGDPGRAGSGDCALSGIGNALRRQPAADRTGSGSPDRQRQRDTARRRQPAPAGQSPMPR